MNAQPATSASELSLALNDSLNLRLPIAGPGARAYAFLIDFKIRLFAALLWLSIGFKLFTSLSSETLAGVFDRDQRSYLFIVLIPTMAIYFLYHPVFELLWRGRTPGKKLAGIRIVDAQTGTSPNFSQVLLRNVFRLVDWLPSFYALGIIASFFGRHRARIGDLAAGTVLVHDPSSARQIRKTLRQMERQQVMSDANWNAAKSLLERWHGLLPKQRAELFNQLAEMIASESDMREFETPIPPTKAQQLKQLKLWVG
jgi:uncharacterized RDD family membrane protein YckC